MTFRLARAAEQDLLAVYLQGCEQFGLAQAEEYWTELHRVMSVIGEHPQLGREMEKIEPAVRVHAHRAHVIVYRIEDDGVPTILRIRNARENWKRGPV